jgi:hypothetical protein
MSSVPGVIEPPAVRPANHGDDENAWCTALETQWYELGRSLSDCLVGDHAATTAEERLRMVFVLDRWRSWFNAYADPAEQLNRAGMPALRNRLEQIEAQLKTFMDMQNSSIAGPATKPAAQPSAAPEQTAEQRIAAIRAQMDADRQAFQRQEVESERAAVEASQARMDAAREAMWESSSRASDQAYRTMQQGADRMWNQILLRRR